MIDVCCAICQWQMQEPGGLLFSPPQKEMMVYKTHVCVKCWPLIVNFIDSERFGFHVD